MAHQQRDNALLAHQALMKGCVFSGGPTAPAAPLLYLLKREPSKAAILTDLDNASIRCVLAAAGPLRLVWIGFASVTDDATFRVKIAADEAAMDTDTLLYDSRVAGVDLPCTDGQKALPHRKNRRHFFILLDPDAAITAACVEVEIFDTGNPAGSITIGNLVIADPFQSRVNVAYGLQPPWPFDPSQQSQAKPGQSPALERSPYDLSQFQLAVLDEDEAIGAMRDFVEQVFTTGLVLCIQAPRAPRYVERWTLCGKFVSLQPLILPRFERFSIDITMKEVIP